MSLKGPSERRREARGDLAAGIGVTQELEACPGFLAGNREAAVLEQGWKAAHAHIGKVPWPADGPEQAS